MRSQQKITRIMTIIMIAFGLYVSFKIIMPIITIIRKRNGSNKEEESGNWNHEDHIHNGREKLLEISHEKKCDISQFKKVGMENLPIVAIF